MKKFKSIIGVLLAVLMLVSVVACAPAPAAEAPAPAAEAPAPAAEAPAPAAEAPAPAAEVPATEPVTLKLWFWDNVIEEQYKLMIADFESKNPGIKIEYSIASWNDYWTKLQTALPTGEGPDLFWLNHPNAVTYMPTDNLLDLTTMGLDMSHFSEKLITPFKLADKTYGVPIFFDTVVMFYNKALFDEAGIPYPQRGWTWEDMRNTAIKLTKANGDDISQYGIAFSPGVQAGSLEFVMQNGGHVFSEDHMSAQLDNPEAKEAIQFLLDLKFKDKVALTGTDFLQMNQMGELFINNMVAMEVSGMWRVKPYADALGDKVGIAHLPKQKVEADTFHNVAYAASAKTKHPEAVKAFMEYASSQAHGDIIASAFLPAYKESQPAWFTTFPALDLKVFSEAEEYAFPLQIAAKNAGSVFPILEQGLEKLYSSPELGNALVDLDTAVNAEINK